MEICPHNQCAGCYACYNICPVHCISMKEDGCGFIYPVIDENKCIKCGMCRKVCFNNQNVPFQIPYEVFAAWSKNSHERNTSSSGGLAATLTSYVLSEGGIVFGAVWNSDKMQVLHTDVTSQNDSIQLKGSKYVHSYIEDTFKRCKRYLHSGKTVLFIATPCQIAGLKKFLNKDYDNLYTIDIVCHGVPSQKMLKDHIQCVLDKEKFSSVSVSFRHNNDFKLTLLHGNDVLYSKKASEDLYLKPFLNTSIFRENCYHCPFAQPERVSDMTIGDFWGLKAPVSQEEINRGISCVLINTAKGGSLFKQVRSKLTCYKRDLDEAVAGNSQLGHPSERGPEYNVIMSQLRQKKIFDEVIYHVYKREIILHRIKNRIKKIDSIVHMPIVSSLIKIKNSIKGKKL